MIARTRQLVLIVMVVLTMAACGSLWGQGESTSRPAASQPATHITSLKNLTDAVKATDSASAAMPRGIPTVVDTEIFNAESAVNATVKGLLACEHHIGGRQGAASAPSATVVMHRQFVDKLQDAIKNLDAAKAAFDRKDVGNASAHLRRARDQVGGVLAVFGGGPAPTSRPGM